ncbi:MAG: proton-conducting transporter transmembrane domain-containing protein [Solirubrobacteraceae bacterium]
MSAVALIGVGALIGGGVLPLVPRLGGSVRPALALQAAGVALLGVTGFAVLLGGSRIGAGFRSTISPSFGLDPLSGFFLALLAVTSLPTLVFAGPYLDGLPSAVARRDLAALIAAFLLALAGVLAARDVSSFLACWELMTVFPAAAILVARRDPPVRSAVYAYLAITHLGGTGVWVSLLVLAHYGAIGHPAALAAAGSTAQTVVAIAALIGFGTKAGFVPLHSWLPRAHPVAPAPLSALMSGMMIKVALYGLIRVEFQWLGAKPRWLGLTLLALGVVSALGGVLWALAQHDLKRLLAYHSIENIGIIALGLGASLLFARAGNSTWSAIAFGAALLHIANHAIFKTLLFLGAGAFERAVGSLDLDHLGGLLRRMPWTGGAFLVGSMAIAGLPPLNGFASEWLTLQSLLHISLSGPLGVALTGAGSLAALAATAALALLCFVKVVGLALLGRPRREECASAVEPAVEMRFAVVSLAVLCVVLGLLPGVVLPILAKLAPGHESLARHIGLNLPGTGALPALGLAVALIALTLALIKARGRRRLAPAKAPTWACGQPVVPELEWSSAAFTKPLRLVLEVVMRPERELEVVRADNITQRISYSSHTPSLVDRLLYEPAVRVGLRGAAVARRLQTGNVRTYAGYLLAVVVLLLVLTGTGALG